MAAFAAMNAKSFAPKPCPVCGTAMVASKSDAQRAQDDIFSCLNCDFVLTLSAAPGADSSADSADD